MLQVEYQLKKAADFETQGKLLHAVQIYHAIISENKDFTLAYIRLASLYDRMEKLEAATNLLSSYLENCSEDKDIRLFLGEILLKNSLWDEAVEVLSLIITEEQPIVSFFMGFGYFMMKDYQIARVHFLNFLSNNSTTEYHFETYLYLTKINAELEQFEEALEYIKCAEKIHTNWETHFLTGIIYYHQGMYYHSVLALEKALKLNDTDKSVVEWTGKAYLKLGDFPNAHKYLSSFIESAEPTAETYSYMGLACLNMQKLKEAGKYFELALNLDPANQAALDGIKKCT